MALSKLRKPSSGLSNTRRTSSGTTTFKRDTYGKEWYAKVAEIRKRDGDKCVDCQATTELQPHHIKPLSRGGLTHNTNLLTLCHDCHERRHRHSF